MPARPYILLVDDNPRDLHLLKQVIEAEGYHTQTASTGAEAIKLAQHQCPQLVFLDVCMPDISGFQICEQLRLIDGMQQVPIFFLSALHDAECRLIGLQALGNDYLTKPFNIDLLIARVNSAVRMAHLRHQRV